MHLLRVPDMKCGGCLGAVTRAIRTIDETVQIEADLDSREIRISSNAPEAAILNVLREAGYPAEPISTHAQ
jgi:copper chaperone